MGEIMLGNFFRCIIVTAVIIQQYQMNAVLRMLFAPRRADLYHHARNPSEGKISHDKGDIALRADPFRHLSGTPSQ